MKWPIYKINDICKVSGGKRLPKGHQFVDSKTKHPYIRITDMSFDSLSTDGLLYITEETFKHISRYTISKDDIYISIAGTIGYVGKIPEFIDGANLTENCAKLSEFSDEINRDYLLYYLRSPRGNGELLVRKGGASQPKLALERIKTVPVPVPPINIQSRIANILSAYDDLIQNNKKQIKLMEEVAMRLYKEWFVNLRFPGHENTKIVDGVPEGWICSKTKDFIKFKYGKALKADDRIEGRYPVYGSSGVVGYHNEFLVEAPVVIVGRKGNVGSVYISFVNAFPIDTVYYIESEISIYYSYFNLLTRSFINNDSAVPGLNRNYAESMEMLCPSKYLQNEFDNKVSLLFERQNNLRHQIDLLKQARDKLLPKLMSGEIEV